MIKKTRKLSCAPSIKERLIKNNLGKYNEFISIPELLIKGLVCKNLKLVISIYSFLIITCKNVLEKDLELSKLQSVSLEKQISDFNSISNIYNKYKNNSKFYIVFSNLYKKYVNDHINIVLLNNYNNLMKFLDNYRVNFKKPLKDNILKSNVLIERLALETSDGLRLDNCGDISSFGSKAYERDVDYLRMLTLQVLLFVLNVNKCFKFFVHNDLKMNNILVFNKEYPLIIDYKYKNKRMSIEFFERYIFKLNDFDFSNFDSYNNTKIEHSKFANNDHWIYDVHFFVHSMIVFITEEKLMKIDSVLFNNLKKYFLFGCTVKKIRCNNKNLEEKRFITFGGFYFR